MNFELQEEGFDQDEAEQLIIDASPSLSLSRPTPLLRSNRRYYREPKLKLTYFGRDQLQQTTLLQRSGLMFDKTKKDRQSSSTPIQQNGVNEAQAPIGDNIQLFAKSYEQSHAIRKHMASHQLMFQQARQLNTHGYIKSLKRNTFLTHPFNKKLSTKINSSYIAPKIPASVSGESISFQGTRESSNLESAYKVAPNHYRLFLRHDTNTHGHQSWFYFAVKNNTKNSFDIKITISNFRRDWRQSSMAHRIYTRKGQQWVAAGRNFVLSEGLIQPFSKFKSYEVSFELTLEPEAQQELSLFPAYTYSDMLREIDSLPESVEKKVLGYSSMGLGIPLLSFGLSEPKSDSDSVVVITSRIHPGESMSSWMASGLIKRLASHKQLLNIAKVIVVPMMNPDGVILGNFRTNLMGNDLNRQFCNTEECINPQVLALKQLALSLRQTWGNRQIVYLDLHGHSSAPNIFTYGPNYSVTEPNFYGAKLLPKLLNLLSPSYFRYAQCSFKLQPYKQGTGRAFFLNEIKALAYTLEASSVGETPYDTGDWIQFGSVLPDALFLLLRYGHYSSIRSRTDLSLTLSEVDKERLTLIARLKRDIKKQSSALSISKEKSLNQAEKEQTNSDQEDSDQDLSPQEKHKANSFMHGQYRLSLPRVSRPAIMYPVITPSLYQQPNPEQTYKIIMTRRNRFHSVRLTNQRVDLKMEISSLRPIVRNLRADRRVDL